MRLYQAIAHTIAAMKNCEVSGNTEWFARHESRLRELERALPSGSGIDAGCRVREDSTSDRLRIVTAFHHMNEDGMYDGWTDHVVTVTGDLMSEIAIKISGCNRNEIKEYLHDVFDAALREEVGQ